MVRALIILAFLTTSVITQRAQTVNTAVVRWEPYRFHERDVAVALPKMPTVTPQQDMCNENASVYYVAYAEAVVYQVRLTKKMKVPDMFKQMCPDRMKFGPKTLEKRLGQIRGDKEPAVESKETINGRDVHRFTGKRSVRLVISDIAAGERWLEISAHYDEGSNPDLDPFLTSFDFNAKSGVEVRDGSPMTLGDPVPAAAIPSSASTPTETDAADKTKPVAIVFQPKARYTDLARQQDVKGAVRLRAQLLPNGSVGEITVISTLPAGLTEQAIAAMQKIAFLPKRVNGVAVAATVTREYTFTIY
jgi:TonB family protein